MDVQYITVLSSFLTPVVILVLGIWAKRIATEHARRISLNERIIAKRVQIYEQIGEDLNDIYTFILQIGQWKELTPADIIKKKRVLDRTMYVSRPYWSDKAFASYCAFMRAAFEAWTGVGEDAKIRTWTDQYKKLEHWDAAWEKYFSHKEPDISGVRQGYRQLMAVFAEQFGFIQD